MVACPRLIRLHFLKLLFWLGYYPELAVQIFGISKWAMKKGIIIFFYLIYLCYN